MSEKFPNVLSKKPLINTSKNLNKFQVGKMQRLAPRHIIVKRQDKKEQEKSDSSLQGNPSKINS